MLRRRERDRKEVKLVYGLNEQTRDIGGVSKSSIVRTHESVGREVSDTKPYSRGACRARPLVCFRIPWRGVRRTARANRNPSAGTVPNSQTAKSIPGPDKRRAKGLSRRACRTDRDVGLANISIQGHALASGPTPHFLIVYLPN